MAQDRSFEQILADLRQRKDEAALEVYNRYAGGLIRLAQRHLDARMRQKVDPEDVIQSVLRTLFVRLAEGQFAITDWDGLWGLLTRLTIHKCNRQIRYYHAEKRQIDREAQQPTASDPGTLEAAPTLEPTPEEALVLAETLEQVLHGLEELDRQIVAHSLEGHTPAEISDQLGCTDSKVYRVLRRVRERLERLRTSHQS